MLVEHFFAIEVKGKEPITMSNPPKVWTDELKGLCEELVGDGLAEVERLRSAGYSMGYGNVRIHGHCKVKLTCNQDAETIKRASDIASYIVDDTIFQEDAQVMQEFLEHHRKAGVVDSQ